MRLKDKRVVITAAASGMGRAGCELFTREGATVVAVDIDQPRLDAMVEAIRAGGGHISAIRADLLSDNNCTGWIDEAARRMDGLDVLWNHAGIAGVSGIETLSEDDYATCMNLNVRSAFRATGAALPHLRRSGGGSVLFTASIAGLVGATVSPIYSTAKFAVVGMAKSFALRLAADKIRVNAICPGLVETPMLPLFFDPGASVEEAKAAQVRVLAAVPMGRLARPQEIAHAALWLASDDASFVTGVALPVDGGFTAR
ncbi:SDR family NAD(P)-dependent oxidoreductase [Variovorax sp. J22R133]|uniref:SDR family NAD(P)-dependent oxidoreductase n=1 Tax=Variovorax brevis TaxID=3053503 RepID=UPI0025781B2B|nr:SDR family NAD(P)-dependent oxidoreductase [Variovorax sp. J22R133]MDM0113609.1 SDR family NAD(P)-dependent oxidoreductase [Variovorax sp. J22R133]